MSDEYNDYYVEYVDGEVVIRDRNGIDVTTLNEYEHIKFENRDEIIEAIIKREGYAK